MKVKKRSVQYLKGYNAGKAYLSNVRRFYSKKIEELEKIIDAKTQ